MLNTRTRRTLLVCAFTATTATAQNLAGNSNPNGFTTSQAEVFGLFAANDQTSGMELWRVDFFTSAVNLVVDIRPGAAGSNPRELTPYQGNYMFAADDGANGIELWQTDGTTASLAANIHPMLSSYPRQLTTVGSLLFFVADNGTNGEELWQWDGTTASLVKDIQIGGSSRPQHLTAFGSQLLFSADDGMNGRELWISDGTAPGTNLLADIRPGPNGSGPRSMTPAGPQMLFVADDGTVGAELWGTDGTAAGTQLIRDIEPGPLGSSPGGLVSQFRAFFAATTTANGRELWISDGTTAGTTLVSDIQPGAVGSEPDSIIINNLFDVWFVADDGTTGREIWRVDATGGGLTRMTDIVPGSGSINPTDLVRTGVPGQVAFSENPDSVSDTPRLWVTDTSVAPQGATMVATFRNGPLNLTRNESLFGFGTVFVADDLTQGLELWRLDAGTSTASMVANIAPDTLPLQRANLDLHTDATGTSVTICIDNGPPGTLGIIAFGPSPGPGVTLPIVTGPILLSTLLLVVPVILDGSGMACITINVPNMFIEDEFVTQGFTVDPMMMNIFPLTATDLGSFRVSIASVPLFGGTTKVVGIFNDEDHRYETSINLPAPGSSGAWHVHHLIEDSDGVQTLEELEDEIYRHIYDGKQMNVFLKGKTPKGTIKGIQIWFVNNSGDKFFVWRSYC